MRTASVSLALAVVGVALVALTGCADSANSTACKLYEDAYNRVTDAVREKQPAEYVKAQSSALPSRIADAFDKASGDVAVALRDSRDLAEGMIADIGDDDTGTAFFLQAQDVAKACSAAGASISLHETS